MHGPAQLLTHPLATTTTSHLLGTTSTCLSSPCFSSEITKMYFHIGEESLCSFPSPGSIKTTAPLRTRMFEYVTSTLRVHQGLIHKFVRLTQNQTTKHIFHHVGLILEEECYHLIITLSSRFSRTHGQFVTPFWHQHIVAHMDCEVNAVVQPS